MQLDLSRPWALVLLDARRSEVCLSPAELDPILVAPANAAEPAEFAAAELASFFATVGGRPPRAGDAGESDPEIGLVFLHVGSGGADSSGGRRRFSWRASPERIELYGEGPVDLLAAVYSFLEAAGASWPYPGSAGERLPAGPEIELALPFRSEDAEAGPTLIIGHAAYFEAASTYMLWAARNGYSRIFVHTTPEAVALGAVPARNYERSREEVRRLAIRLGLSLELGGHGLSALLPRALFHREPELFRMVEGRRKNDRNFCPSNPRSLERIGESFLALVGAHPEIAVFHLWPDDLPGGGWCSCPACAGKSPTTQSLETARFLAGLLERERPEARLSFLAYHDTEDFSSFPGSLPANLELLWAPRLRSWERGLDESETRLNEVSAEKFHRAAEAWRRAGGGSVTVFEYWEDEVLFKFAVPPLGATMAGDLRIYRPSEKNSKPPAVFADRIGVLLTGTHLPLAPRPNPWMLPRLMRDRSVSPEVLLKTWAEKTYGPAAEPMSRYWEALHAAWRFDLELGPGDSAISLPGALGDLFRSPPADWGDPWKSGPERLRRRREQSEHLFERQREAEAALAEAEDLVKARAESRIDANTPAWSAAVEAEARQYSLTAARLELGAARLAAYHERAEGQERAAADIALIAESILAGLYRKADSIPDPRGRRNLRYLGLIFFGLRFRSMRPGGLFAPLKILGTLIELGCRHLGMRRLWESKKG